MHGFIFAESNPDAAPPELRCTRPSKDGSARAREP